MNFTNRLVERGSLTEQDGRRQMEDLLVWHQKNIQKNIQMAEQGLQDVETELQRQVEAVLRRTGLVTKFDIEKMNLPTKADIQALGDKVTALSRKVDELRKAEKQQNREAEVVKAA